MKPFTYGGYVYLNDIAETPNHYYQISAHRNDPNMTVTTTIILFKMSLIKFTTMFV